MSAKTGIPVMPDTYFELVREFPLVHIQNDVHLHEAMAFLDGVLARKLDKGGQEYLDVLTDLVEAYERAHTAIPGASEADVLRELMNANRLSQARLSELTGIAQSTISDVLNERRGLTKEQIKILSRHFGVTMLAFMQG